MQNKILNRIARETGIPDILEALSEKLSSSDLQSLLLEVYSRRAALRTPPDLLQDYSNSYVQPSNTAPLLMMELDRIYFDLASGFEPLELSPLAPLGNCSIIATAHQNKIVSTIRNTEVVADCTNVLALECAIRRAKLLRANSRDKTPVRLCASHRHVRAQPLPDPRFLRHFRIFGMCTAGSDRGSFSFEIEGLLQQLRFYLNLMTNPDIPFRFQNVEVHITDLSTNEIRKDVIVQSVIDPLRSEFPTVRVDLYPERTTGRGYYQDVCFHVNASNQAGDLFNLADGGLTNWTQRLLSNRKERLLISGIGSELICLRFRR